MSRPGYGIKITYHNGRVEKRVVASHPRTRNNIANAYRKDKNVKEVIPYTEKDYF